MTILVTGATGFVGTGLLKRIALEGRVGVRAAVRNDASVLPPGIERVHGTLAGATDWQPALGSVQVVIHLAARVHVMHETSAHPLDAFRQVNVDGTLNLARQAAAAGVRRFVFLSSVKVNGESGTYAESDSPGPKDPYGTSKYEAELGLWKIADATRMEVVVIRPPLVYGPGVRGNFESLMRAVARGIPLPLGAIDNRRSLVALDNLTDFILTCAEHAAAANETFLVSDGDDLSTADLVRRLARAMGRSARLLSIPPTALMTAATLLGKRAMARRLVGSLQVNISKAQRQLGWRPPVSVDEGLRRAAASWT